MINLICKDNKTLPNIPAFAILLSLYPFPFAKPRKARKVYTGCAHRDLSDKYSFTHHTIVYSFINIVLFSSRAAYCLSTTCKREKTLGALYFSLLAQSIFRISRIFKNYTRTVNKIMASVNSKMTTFAYRTGSVAPVNGKI